MEPIFYAAIIVLAATMSITVITYMLIVFGWCGFSARLPHPSPSTEEKNNSGVSPYIASTFMYQKGVESEKAGAASDSEPGECAVCLSGFKDGDNVCQLPRCNHSFHSPCIDMWLYSHSDCPVCRAPVDRINPRRMSSASTIEENSREVLLDVRILS